MRTNAVSEVLADAWHSCIYASVMYLFVASQVSPGTDWRACNNTAAPGAACGIKSKASWAVRASRSQLAPRAGHRLRRGDHKGDVAKSCDRHALQREPVSSAGSGAGATAAADANVAAHTTAARQLRRAIAMQRSRAQSACSTHASVAAANVGAINQCILMRVSSTHFVRALIAMARLNWLAAMVCAAAFASAAAVAANRGVHLAAC